MARRTKEEAAKTRRDLLQAALEIFSQKGYVAATLEEIAARAGVTRGAVYWHFEGKAGLYKALIEEVQARSNTIVQEAVSAGGSVIGVLRQVFIRLLTAVEEDAALRATIELGLFRTASIPELEEVRLSQMEAGQQLLTGITGAMQQAALDGELRADLDPMEMARGYLALLNGIIHQWLPDQRAFSLSRIGSALVNMYLHGVLPAG